jgi:hypothetical protein
LRMRWKRSLMSFITRTSTLIIGSNPLKMLMPIAMIEIWSFCWVFRDGALISLTWGCYLIQSQISKAYLRQIRQQGNSFFLRFKSSKCFTMMMSCMIWLLWWGQWQLKLVVQIYRWRRWLQQLFKRL